MFQTEKRNRFLCSIFYFRLGFRPTANAGTESTLLETVRCKIPSLTLRSAESSVVESPLETHLISYQKIIFDFEMTVMKNSVSERLRFFF